MENVHKIKLSECVFFYEEDGKVRQIDADVLMNHVVFVTNVCLQEHLQPEKYPHEYMLENGVRVLLWVNKHRFVTEISFYTVDLNVTVKCDTNSASKEVILLELDNLHTWADWYWCTSLFLLSTQFVTLTLLSELFPFGGIALSLFKI